MAACVHAPAALRVSPFQVLRRKIGKHTGTFYGHSNITVSQQCQLLHRNGFSRDYTDVRILIQCLLISQSTKITGLVYKCDRNSLFKLKYRNVNLKYYILVHIGYKVNLFIYFTYFFSTFFHL